MAPFLMTLKDPYPGFKFDYSTSNNPKMVQHRPTAILTMVSYSPPIGTMAVSVAVYEIFSVKEWRNLKTGVRVVQGY